MTTARPTTSFLDAAISILQSTSRALTASEITSRAIERGVLVTSGKTPEATMSKVLYSLKADQVGIVRVYEPGDQRARRGSVRWRIQRR